MKYKREMKNYAYMNKEWLNMNNYAYMNNQWLGEEELYVCELWITINKKLYRYERGIINKR